MQTTYVRSTGTIEEREARIAAAEAPIRARADQSQKDAESYRWVYEAYYSQSDWQSRTTPPDRYILPEHTLLQEVWDVLYDHGTTNRHALGYIAPTRHRRS